ncbi:aromatic-L-amino-acid decarboxylase [Mesoterricola silvestris]|uniref:Aromatic-L-amino-acid decarboxylase n=2 Tax=Mesoterricola silvestris TaxID=2927979 RepID=A0AA48GM40_9BACT|nr:aromatic-L-amino-acid decarboxylase [Mesoterricola silvestris]
MVEWIAGYRERMADLPVMSPLEPGDVKRMLPAAPPLKGGSLEGVTGDLDRIVLPGITHWNHPGFFAYFPSNSDLASVLADMACAGLGAQGMSWQTSPAATEVEEVVMEWLRVMLGLGPEFTGVIQDTASTSTFCALLCAREWSSAFGQARGGLQAEEAPLVVYASDQAHSSIEKAALLAGFGRNNLRLIPTDADHALRMDLLEAAIVDDLAAGRRPCAMVAAIGTTATTAVDPLAGMARLSARHGIWLHVDAAMAGTAMICPECRPMWEGIESADSIVLNPHKWMGTGFDLSAYFVKDPEHLIRVMSTNPSYLHTEQDGQVKNLRDWGIPLGRRFRALKLWFLVRSQGVEGLQARIRRDLANAQWLKAQVLATGGWELMAPVNLQTVCVRHVPVGMTDEAELRAHNLALLAAVNKAGTYYLTPSVLKGRQILRVSIGASATELADVEGLWKALIEASMRVAG